MLNHLEIDRKRRKFLIATLAGSMVASLGACATGRDIRPARDIYSRKSGLHIDAHCHVFNVLDVDAKNFATKIIKRYTEDYENYESAVNAIDKIVQKVIVAARRSAKKRATYLLEDQYLDKLLNERNQKSFSINSLLPMDKSTVYSKFSLEIIQREFGRGLVNKADFDDSLEKELEQLIAEEIHEINAASASIKSSESGLTNVEPKYSDLDEILKLKEFDHNRDEIRRDLKKTQQPQPINSEKSGIVDRAKATNEAAKKVVSVIKVILKVLRIKDQIQIFTNKRIVNTWKMMNAYSTGPSGISLYTPSLVDFDKWVQADCQVSPKLFEDRVTLEEQVKLMSKISIITNGAILPFVAYCPRREVEDKENRKLRMDEDGESLSLVKLAIQEYGFIGVKVYPPIGFYPANNKSVLSNELCNPLGAKTTIDDFGVKIDHALNELYEWCQDHNVPIMAHGNNSMGITEEDDLKSHPLYWERVLKDYPDLRISLGHFGGMEDLTENKGATWPLMISRLMSRYPNLYADLSNYSDMIKHWYDIFEYSNICARRTYFKKLRKIVTHINNDIEKSRDASGNKYSHRVHDRLMYGSDWHMLASEVNYESYFDDFRSIYNEKLGDIKNEIGPKVVDKFIGANAIRFLGLDLKQSNAVDSNMDYLYKFFVVNDISPSWLMQLPEGSLLRKLHDS